MTRRHRSENGQAAVETLGIVPLLAVCALGIVQALLLGHTAVATEQAARVAARTAMVAPGDAEAAARDALPSWLRDDAEPTVSGTRAEVQTVVPDVLPGLDLRLTLRRSVEMPEVAAWD